jgi:hypothetical protein
MEQSTPKRHHIEFKRRGITQKKEYNDTCDCHPSRYVFADLDWNCADGSIVLILNVGKYYVPECTASQPPKTNVLMFNTTRTSNLSMLIACNYFLGLAH